jgi:molecular chaperone GrpE
MQEALAAVETARAKRESGDEIQAPGQPTVGNAEVGEVAKLEETVAELRDRSQRTLADFENFRRRVDRERQEDRRFAAFDTLREFLAVVDNLERALASEGSTDDLKVGVELIHRQMKDLMKNAGVERILALGEEFDPRFHEAVSHHEDLSVAVPTVSSELQAGYLMHDRLLRPSVVKVAMPAESDDDGRVDN